MVSVMSDEESGVKEAGFRQRVRILVEAARWLAGSTIRRHPIQLAVVSVGQVIGALGTALGTIAVIFYIRAAVGDGSLGRAGIEINIESAAEPRTAAIFLVSLLVVVSASAWAIWRTERQIAELAREHAARLRQMIITLLADHGSEGWQSTIDHKRPAIALHQALVAKVRSSTVALTDLLTLAPSIVLLFSSLVVMILIDPIATLVALPIAAVFGVIGERVNREVQELTQTYDSRQQMSRDLLVEQLEDLADGVTEPENLSFSRTETDDKLFHDRQLATTKLQVLGLVNSAFMFAAVVAYFIIVRGVEDLSIEIIIAFTFAIRFAARSVQQVFKAFVQVSRRLEDIRIVQGFIAGIDAHRLERALRADPDSALPSELAIDVGADTDPLVIGQDKPLLILTKSKPDESEAWAVLHVIETAVISDELDLIGVARIIEVTDENPVPDMLASDPVRMIISDEPQNVVNENRNAFTFIMHNRPKLVLGKSVQNIGDQFAGLIVVVDDEIVWSGTVADAAEDDEHLRGLVRRGRTKKAPASTAPDTSTP